MLGLEAVEQISTWNPESVVHVVCRNEYHGFVESVKKNHSNIAFIGVTVHGDTDTWPDYDEFKRIIEIVHGFSYEKVFVMLLHPWAWMLGACVSSKYYTCFAYERNDAKSSPLLLKIKRSRYDRVYVEKDEVFLARGYQNWLKQNDIDYQCKGVALQLDDLELPDYRENLGEYILFAPMGAKANRSLNQEKVEGIINALCKISAYKIVLTGTGNHFAFFQNVIHNLQETHIDTERIINYAGKTSTDEFMALIRDAKLVIGPDSGHIHLAAALNVPSVALCHYEVPPEFLPYDYEQINDEIEAPVCIFSKEKYDCKYCREIMKRGENTRPNVECDERERNGRTVLCLDEIDLKDVIDECKRILFRLQGNSPDE